MTSPGAWGFDDPLATSVTAPAAWRDAEGQVHFAFAQDARFILREERSWLQDVDSTRNLETKGGPVIAVIFEVQPQDGQLSAT